MYAHVTCRPCSSHVTAPLPAVAASLTAAAAAAAVVTASGWWPQLKAVQSGRVVLVDGNQMFNRPGAGFRKLTNFAQCIPHVFQHTLLYYVT
jgi:hypothetical protein